MENFYLEMWGKICIFVEMDEGDLRKYLWADGEQELIRKFADGGFGESRIIKKWIFCRGMGEKWTENYNFMNLRAVGWIFVHKSGEKWTENYNFMNLRAVWWRKIHKRHGKEKAT